LRRIEGDRRVINTNDWNVLCLIFNAQRHREFVKGTPFRIELIMPHKDGEWIADQCAYLKHLTPIGYLTEGQFADYKEQAVPLESDLANPFSYWLSEKVDFHEARNEFDGDDARAISPALAGA